MPKYQLSDTGAPQVWRNGKWVTLKAGDPDIAGYKEWLASKSGSTPGSVTPSVVPAPSSTPGAGSDAGGGSFDLEGLLSKKTKANEEALKNAISLLPRGGVDENGNPTPGVYDTYVDKKWDDLSPEERNDIFSYQTEVGNNPGVNKDAIWGLIQSGRTETEKQKVIDYYASKGLPNPFDEGGGDEGEGDFGDLGTGATGPTPQELQLAQASQVANLLAEKSSRQQASLQAVTDVMDAFVKSLKTSVTPELRAEIAESAWMKPEELPAVQNIDYAPMMEQAKAIGAPIEQDIPEMQRALKMMLQPQMKGGALIRAQGGVNYMPQTGSWNPDPYALFAGQGGQVSNIQPGQDWIDPLQTYHQQTNPAWQRDIQEQTGYVVPGLTGALSREWGTGYESAIREGRALPTLERQKLEEGRRQFDVGEANALEIEEIRSTADRDVANIQAQGQARAASIMAAADRAAAEAQLQGDLAQADAIRYQADQAARAEIESANIDAEARRDVAKMQEEGANKRMGAQLGMQWAETSQQMAASPRDFLQLAFRQAGVGVPESLSSFMQPNGGATPNMAGAPAGIQQALAQMLGGG